VKGVARTILQLLYVSGLQRWLLGVGLILTLFGIGAQAAGWHPAAQPLFAVAAILGILCTVIAPIVVNGILFRSFSAPRAVQLIPYGRLKLALGAFGAQLLLALFIAITVGTMLLFRVAPYNAPPSGSTAGSLMATVFAIVFSGLTLYFLTFYSALQFPRGGFVLFLGWFITPQLLSRAFAQLHLGALLVTRTGLSAVSMVSLLAWLVFAITYVRSRHIKLPQWSQIGLGPSPPRAVADNTAVSPEPQYSRPAAIRTLLTGLVDIRLRTWTPVFIFLAFIGLMLLTAGAKENSLLWALLICMFSGFFPVILSGLMTARARFLWLTAGLGRAELFTAVEMQSWRMIFIVAGIAMACAIPLLAFSIHAHPANIRFFPVLAMPLVSGAAVVYVSLLYVRGRRRIGDNLIVAGFAAAVFAEIISVVSDPGSTTTVLPSLLGAQVILVPLLRRVAQRRWQNIDWLINRPIRPAAKLV
jgi:hypothetical protein